MAEEFILPDFLQNCDVDTIHEKMLSELPSDIDKTQGGFVWDLTRPTALIASELLEYYIPMTLQTMFPQWSTGNYLDLLAALAQISRKEAAKASVELLITGAEGTVIPAGTVFSTAASGDEGNIRFSTDAHATIGDSRDGETAVRATAVEAGTGANVPADTVIVQEEPITGVTSVTNPHMAVGGIDMEDDDSLRERIIEKLGSNDNSYVGNISDYKRWAESVSGVGNCEVVPEWKGPETVKLVITDNNGERPSVEILDAVYNYIMAPDSPLERLAPPNCILTVARPDLIEVSYAVTATIASGYSAATVGTAFRKKLEDYYKVAAEAGKIRYLKVYALLADIEQISGCRH